MSRFNPDFEFGRVNLKDKDEIFNYVENYYFDKNKYSLLSNEVFVKMLFSDHRVFREFSNRYFMDSKVVSLLFSKENRGIIKSLDKEKVRSCLNSCRVLDKCYVTFFNNDNYYLLSEYNLDLHAFLIPLLESGYDKNPSLTNDFIQMHPEYIIKNRIYKKIEVSKPITSHELSTLSIIKNYLRLDEDSNFYSMLSNDVINSLVESGHYSLLSNKDKREIIERNILYFNSNNVPLSESLLKNKDFFRFICKSTLAEPKNILKVENYISKYYPHLYDKYNALFKELISTKEEKDADDLCYLFFNDYLDNIKNNIDMIKQYAKSNANYKIKIDALSLDNLFSIDFDSINSNEDVERLNQALKENNIDYRDTIYDCISLARDTFSSELKESLTSLPNKDSVLFSKIDDVDIYNYDGEPLSFVVHCSSIKSGDPATFAAKKDNSLKSSSYERTYLSASYINDNNIRVYEKDAIIFGFNNLENMNLVSANPYDSFTSNNLDDPINYPATYLNLDEFSNHAGYSELVFMPTKLKPNFIVCFDEVDDYDLEMAKKMNIPVVCINSSKYVNNNKKEYKKTNQKYINY